MKAMNKGYTSRDFVFFVRQIVAFHKNEMTLLPECAFRCVRISGVLMNFLTNFALLLKSKKMYPADIVIPMKEELTENGFSELKTPEEVVSQLDQKGTTLVMINSVCGCSAGTARPGVLMAVANATKKPEHLTTSFAGFDIDAVRTLRERLLPYPPSSPSVALFKDGQLVHMIERHHIEGRSAQMIAHNLIAAFDEYC